MMIVGVRCVLRKSASVRLQGILRGFSEGNTPTQGRKFVTAAQIESDPALKSLFEKELDDWTRNYFLERQR